MIVTYEPNWCISNEVFYVRPKNRSFVAADRVILLLGDLFQVKSEEKFCFQGKITKCYRINVVLDCNPKLLQEILAPASLFEIWEDDELAQKLIWNIVKPFLVFC